MGAIGGMLGLNGGAAGTGFASPTGTNVLNPTTTAQAGQAYQGNQTALQQQQALLQALQAQNGIGNQSSVYNQMQGVANGTGSNPAQAMLNQATGQNVANQAALMAGQRGAGANVGLMARQAAQQGSNAQQQAAGQAATMQANQSLNALNNMGNIAGQQVSNQIGAVAANTQAQQAEQANLLNSINSQNNANVGMQGNINTSNASLANTAMGQQGQMIGGIMNGASSLMSSLADGGQVGYDDGGVVDAPVPQMGPGPTPAPAPAQKSGGGGGGSMLSMLALLANGGIVQRFDQGGMPIGAGAAIGTGAGTLQATNAPQSAFGQFLAKVKEAGNPTNPTAAPTPGNQGALFTGASNLTKGIVGAFGGNKSSSSPSASDNTPQSSPTDSQPSGNYDYNTKSTTDSSGNTTTTTTGTPPSGYASGGKVNALVSPGEKWLPPSKVEAVKKGASPMKVGETIPGRAKVEGARNSYANDTVPKKLEVGGIVIPRSVTQGKDAERKSIDFVRKTLAKKR